MTTYSKITYTATAGQTVFGIPFPLLQTSDLSVTRAGVLLEEETDYTVSGSDVTLLSPALAAEEVVLQRDSGLGDGAVQVDFQKGAIIRERDLDRVVTQLRYLIQETLDAIGFTELEIEAITGLQDALDGKSPVGHGHDIEAITGLQAELDSKALEDHTHLKAEITDLGQFSTSALGLVPSPTADDVSNNRILNAEGVWIDPPSGTGTGGAVSSVYGRTGNVVAQAGDYTAAQVDFTPGGDLASLTVQDALDELDAEKAPLVHTHAEADVTGLTAALAGKAALAHTHVEADVTGLTAALAGKADVAHVHSGLVPTGGAADQVLRKIDGTPYNYAWQDAVHFPEPATPLGQILTWNVSGDPIALEPTATGDILMLDADKVPAWVVGPWMLDLVDDTTPSLGGDLDVGTRLIKKGTHHLLNFVDSGVVGTNSTRIQLQVQDAADNNFAMLRANTAAGTEIIDLLLAAQSTGNVRVSGALLDHSTGSVFRHESNAYLMSIYGPSANQARTAAAAHVVAYATELVDLQGTLSTFTASAFGGGNEELQIDKAGTWKITSTVTVLNDEPTNSTTFKLLPFTRATSGGSFTAVAYWSEQTVEAGGKACLTHTYIFQTTGDPCTAQYKTVLYADDGGGNADFTVLQNESSITFERIGA